MPNFPDPFSGNVNREINQSELIQAIRMDIVGELEAIYLYDAHAMATTDPFAKKVLEDIRDEEKEHVGELMMLLRHLDEGLAELLANGEGEVREMMEDLGIKEKTPEGATVGSLIEN